MSDTIETETIHTGDVRETLPELPTSSVHMCMTSPPYYGLRDYQEDEQIGLEESLDEYISELVGVGDALRRVLRDDGSWWLNLGDGYAGSGRGAWDKDDQKESWTFNGGKAPERDTNLKRKNKMLVPHRVAIALQEAGWVVRNDVTWLKPNPMPQSVKDRLNTTTEQIFHLTPQPDYWYDLDAIREPYAEKTKIAKKNGHSVSGEKRTRDDSPGNHDEGGLYAKSREEQMNSAGKNPGDVFEITTEPFPDAHFAVYPSALCDKPIKASCPPTVCAECGAPYERESEGWSQTCECDTDDTEPGIVIDPFAGAGTTLLKAKQLGRRFVGVELNAEYADMARARVGLDVDDVSRIRDDEQQHGLDGFAE